MFADLSTAWVLITFTLFTTLTAPLHWYLLKGREPLISKGFLWKSSLVFILGNLVILPFWFLNVWVFIIMAAIVYGFMIVLFYLSIGINKKNSGGTRTII